MNQSYIRGLATGLFLAASLIAIFTIGNPEKKEENQLKPQPTRTEAISILEKDGYRLFSSSQWDAYVKEQEKRHTVERQSTENKMVKINVKQGTSSEQVIQDLQKKEIIKDSKDFREYLDKRELTKKIQTGTYVVSSEMDYSTLAAILTK